MAQRARHPIILQKRQRQFLRRKPRMVRSWKTSDPHLQRFVITYTHYASILNGATHLSFVVPTGGVYSESTSYSQPRRSLGHRTRNHRVPQRWDTDLVCRSRHVQPVRELCRSAFVMQYAVLCCKCNRRSRHEFRQLWIQVNAYFPGTVTPPTA